MNTIRILPVESPTQNSLIVKLELERYDWSYQKWLEERGATNHALIEFSSYGNNYDNLSSDYKKSQFNLVSYKVGLESVDARLAHYKKNELKIRGVSNIVESNAVRMNNTSAPIIEDWNSDNERSGLFEETLNIIFLKNTPNVNGNGPDWLFDVDSLSISMNYVPVAAGNKTNGIAGTKDNIVVGQAQKEKEPEQEYILIPLCTTDPLISQGPKDYEGDAWGMTLVDFYLRDNDAAFVSTICVLETRRMKGAIVKDRRGACMVCQHPGFEDLHFPDKVYKVEKALYGLHQATRAWYETLLTYLLDNWLSQSMSSLWEELSFFLGLQVKQKSDGIFISFSQDKYVAEILKKFDFASVKTTSTPMETNKALVKDKEAEDVDVHLYRSMIGSLMYLTTSRPDIMFVVCACARF
ncbi:retrovirus-related pol polyprotein from transposon TNT 1-94 [Tanacetum coccineum]